MLDPYSVLGVPRSATDDEVKKHIVVSVGNTTQMQISTIQTRIRRKKNSSRFSRRMSRL